MNFSSRRSHVVRVAPLLPWLMAAPAPAARAAEPWPVAPVHIAPEALEREGIETDVARPGALAEHVEAQAYITADERRISRIRPVGTGRVTEVLVTPGQMVRRGDVLLRYDNFSLSDERQRLAAAEDSLRQAEARERDAALSWRRGDALRGGAVSSGEVERRKARLAEMRALVSQSMALVRNERERMARFSSSIEKASGLSSAVVSPVDGIIRRVNVSIGENIAATSLPPVEIDNLDKVWVVSQVPEDKAGKLAIGGRQETLSPAFSHPITSRIDLIEGGVDLSTRRVLVRSLVPNPARILRPGMLVRTQLFSARIVHGVIIPSDALQTIDEQNCVFVRSGKEAYEARRVALGPSLGGRTVITKGLAAGETVVTRGSFLLKSQALLNPPPQADVAGK
ncbi:efflux RND transporter periplasmic adaptor subunit [Acidomonas methanolica]|uniref:efflux RND transporter periplasmic adaptor subunit n=1 Tax=Acidomonas methanolica TaxID=437 RepID=UPI00211A903A|nr:efflux RND transporter periplasmic adaptor subunit [Acidomonas methanolica]MCQ9154485.1 efflux RND transporter periplasmic adaptor subunit [Acidomonas methanolica]